MLKNKAVWISVLLSLGLGMSSKAEEIETSFVPRDGVIFSLGVFGPVSDDMKETYGLMPLLGVKGSFDLNRNISLTGGVNFGQKSGTFYYPHYYWEGGPLHGGKETRLRAASLELGLRVNSDLEERRRVYGGGGVGLTWAGERFSEAAGELRNEDHTGVAMGLHFLLGGERFLNDTRSFGLEARLNLCSVRVGYHRPEDYYPSRWDFYSIDLVGLSLGATFGVFR